MKRFLKSLLSRKFLIALGSFITLTAQGAYTEAVGVVIAYISAEGYADVKERAGTAEIEKRKAEIELVKAEYAETEYSDEEREIEPGE